jgi:hypothetical protein
MRLWFEKKPRAFCVIPFPADRRFALSGRRLRIVPAHASAGTRHALCPPYEL